MNVLKHKIAEVDQGDFAYYKILRSLEDDRVFLVASLVDGSVSALKVVSKDLLEDSFFNLKREFVMHANFDHPNILKLGEALEDKTRFGFTTSYIGGGDLRERIRLVKRSQIPFILRNIGKGLSHIHAKGFVHADIKPENILISTSGVPIICDFGVTRDLKVKRVECSSKLIGTTKYISPEYLLHGDLGTFTDIYSLGLMAVELFSGAVPGEHLDMIDMLKERVDSYGKEIFEDIPEGLRELIISCLESLPANRVKDGAEFVESINDYIRKAELDEDLLGKQVRLRVSSDIRPLRVIRKTESLELFDRKISIVQV